MSLNTIPAEGEPPPERSSVYADGEQEALRSQISVIEQDIFLFSRTIARNIAFGDDSATTEDSNATTINGSQTNNSAADAGAAYIIE